MNIVIMVKNTAISKMKKEHEVFILEWMLKALTFISIRDIKEKIILETKIEYMYEDAIVKINKSSLQEK